MLELFIEEFVRSRGPDFRGGIVAESQSIGKDDLFRRRKNSQAILRQGEDVVIICGGGDLHFDKEAIDGLQTVLSGKDFTLNAFQTLMRPRL